ncbi:hypothetical protein LN042_00700 [Kitasatospora sp. RB6PN24]|uniref:hypothetical protein n=1 Tax=Kitasatospora humi TaxID=2893891 RepID=UPI001E524340|nr:hypothetical protein [Kitasatospora humi]MCC9305648.1 hypothetical protein [Kitasatospora humi]
MERMPPDPAAHPEQPHRDRPGADQPTPDRSSADQPTPDRSGADLPGAESRRRMREFAESPPYPVHGLRRPVVVPAILGGWEAADGRTTAVRLSYGWCPEAEAAEPPAALGRGCPQLRVDTGPPGSAGEPADLRGVLLDWLGGQAGAEPVHGRSARGELCVLGDAWALRLAVDGQAVTVLGRGVDPADVELGPVGDLLPYVVERDRLLAQLCASRSALPEPELAPAHGIAAVRAFLETFVPGGPDAAESYGALGRRAVAELDGVLRCGPARATYLVYSLVNQITELRRSMPWFSAPHGPRAAAVEELLRHLVLGQPVDSESAQLLWEQYWSVQQRAADADLDWLHGLWVEAWTDWAQRRSSPD